MSLILPMFALVLLTFIVAIITLYSRVHAVKTGQMDARFFKTYQGEMSEQVLKTGRHFSNLFEVPVLFYAGCLAAMVIHVTGPYIQIWAWLFVVARIAHAYIHIGPNKIYPRMIAFFTCVFAVAALWLDVLVASLA
jgi:hypothetical protein